MSAVMTENWLSRHRITVDEYYKMAEVGILDEDSRVELIEGEIIDMAPIGLPHLSVVDRLNRLFVLATGESAIVRIQGTIRLSDFTAPQPDLVLLKPRDDFYATRLANAGDILLIIEVSDSSLRYDRHIKVPLYARYGVSEVWIMDLVNGCAHFFRDLVNGTYQQTSSTARPGITPIPGLTGVTVNLAEVVGSTA
jgi:Uma2 family endonuclease